MYELMLKFLLGLALKASSTKEVHIFPIPKDQSGQPNSPASPSEGRVYFYDPTGNNFSYQPDIFSSTAINNFLLLAGQKNPSERTLIPIDLGDGQKITVTIVITLTPFGTMMIIKIHSDKP